VNPGGANRRVRVVRSGGIAGMRLEREVDLDQLDDDEADGWRRLLDSPAVRAHARGDDAGPTGGAAPSRPRPDGFGYRLVSEDDQLDVTLPEHDLPEDARRLLERALRRT